MKVAEDSSHPLHGKVKVFDRHAFGYQRITVERPLRLRFEVTAEALDELGKAPAVVKYASRDALLTALRSLAGTESNAKADFALALASAGVERLPGPVGKAVWAALSVRDLEGELQTDRKGNPDPDPELRDNENVPLGEDIDDYMRREVLPYVPDAWVDHARTKIGYEIPLTRHFYVYKPPRPLAEIDAELKQLESEIQRILIEVTE